VDLVLNPSCLLDLPLRMSDQSNINPTSAESDRAGSGAAATAVGTSPARSANRSPRSDSSPVAAMSPQEEEEAREAAFQAENIIEARQGYFDDSSSEFSSDSSESGYGSGDSSVRSTSLSSSVRDYAFENGRRYHRYRDGRYQFPNDEQEQERCRLLVFWFSGRLNCVENI
jgi:hypothetical protein